MLVPTITDAFRAAQLNLDVDPYAAWSLGVQEMRMDWATKGPLSLGRLLGYLADVQTELRCAALQDMIAEHLQLAWRDGHGTTLEPYLAEFGKDYGVLASPQTVPADLVEDEFLARYAYPHGDTPTLEEYRKRFSTRPDVIMLLKRRCLAGIRYVKLKQLGQGAMGTVFEAYDHRLRRRVAIKEPRASLGNHPALLEHFREEAVATAGLEHPAIVSVHDYHRSQTAPFYVMRLVEGEALDERIRCYYQPSVSRISGDRNLLWNQLLQAFVTICQGIDYAHAHGVIHRDLKPCNIRIGHFGEISILDWGMAKRLPTMDVGAGDEPHANRQGRSSQNGTLADAVVGTPQYMPPEQSQGISDVRSDVYGLGAILYEVLTASAPHAWPEGFRPANWLQLVRDAEFPSPRVLNPRIPRALVAICLKALSRDPQARYATVAELARDVRRHMAGEQVAAEAEQSRNSHWWRRRPSAVTSLPINQTREVRHEES